MLVGVGLNFTPDGVSTPTALVTINMELLAEFGADTTSRRRFPRQLKIDVAA